MTSTTRKRLLRFGGTVVIVGAILIVLTAVIITIDAFIEIILKGQ